ncbi:MAG TPA: response regulator [Burkholderiales bacterium]|nr:response regulator [Burkholderiales bacterium]
MKTIKRHIALIIDDNEPTRTLLARILDQELDVLSVLAPSCDSALSLARMREFDIILLDLLMPGIGGFEVLKQLRSDSRNMNTPVIILSVLDDRESVDRCMDLKAHAFVTKPVNRNVVAGIVKAHLPDGLRAGRRARWPGSDSDA